MEPERYARLVACIDSLWGSSEARLVHCGQCKLRTSDPFIAGTTEFFSLAYGRQSLHAYPSWRWEYQHTQKVVERTAGTVLDVGAGDGAFQRKLINAGVDRSRLFATEYNAGAREALLGLGVTVTNADLTELPPANHAVICGHQVIQHLADLDGLFQAFGLLTAHDGVVALSVTNGRHKMRQEAAGGLIDMPPNHISTWQRSAFVASADRRGWKLIGYQEQAVSRFESAKALAISKTFQSRQRSSSLAALAERHAPTAQARHKITALSAASRLPQILVTSNESFGGSIWVLLKRA